MLLGRETCESQQFLREKLVDAYADGVVCFATFIQSFQVS